VTLGRILTQKVPSSPTEFIDEELFDVFGFEALKKIIHLIFILN